MPSNPSVRCFFEEFLRVTQGELLLLPLGSRPMSEYGMRAIAKWPAASTVLPTT
jgi:hypothetical protein